MTSLKHHLSSSLQVVTTCAFIAVFLAACTSYKSADYRFPSPAPSEDSPVMGKGQASVSQMASFLTRKNPEIPQKTARRFVEIYVEEAESEGVNHDIAFVQMCLETNFLRFGGQVKKSQYNFCGLGATDDGAAGATFSSVREGVRAHIQHLKAYASTEPLQQENVDPRFELVERGSARYLTDLTGRWATDPNYDRKLNRYLNQLLQM